MEFELVINGLPEHFMEMLQIYATRRLKEDDKFRWLVDNEGFQYAYLWDVQNKQKSGAFIKAQHLPNGKSLLIVHIPDDQHKKLMHWWNLLFNEMNKQGWIEDAEVKDSGHYRYSPAKRKEVVDAYRLARKKGDVINKNSWAKSNFDISAKTLLSYEREYPEET